MRDQRVMSSNQVPLKARHIEEADERKICQGSTVLLLEWWGADVPPEMSSSLLDECSKLGVPSPIALVQLYSATFYI
ncbi:hypothetical protein TNCV_3325281 [Trichonephila clavipes]|nr:hypothetical protein TNCV_3325281 [Trichonephila clavipes]